MSLDTIEKIVPVNKPHGVERLYLYKVGVPITMVGNEASSYLFRPQNGKTLVNATENTVFVSDVPALAGYTFKVVPKVNGMTPTYTVDRLT